MIDDAAEAVFGAVSGARVTLAKGALPLRSLQGRGRILCAPLTGILCHAQCESWKTRWRKMRAAMKPAQIPVPGMYGWNYQKINDLWFRLKYVTHTDLSGKDSQVILARRSANRKEITWINQQLA